MTVVRLPLTILMNNLLIVTGLDDAYVNRQRQWEGRSLKKDKTLQENVGFSHRPEVVEALKRVHHSLRQTLVAYLQPGQRVLDIGSGTGMIARQLVDQWRIVGIDISPELSEAARRHVPEMEVHVGHVLHTPLDGGFAAAYCIGVVQYIPPGQLPRFLARVADLLADDGVFFLQYPHAISRLDLLYPNLLNTKYAPRVVERCAANYFERLEHRHGFYEDKHVETYDHEPYPGDSFVNGYVYIGRKRKS